MIMAEYFAGGHLRFVNGEWRDDNGDAIEISRVRHGRWVHEHMSEGYAWVMCSECEAVIHKILINKRLNYCPNCGAKMDGCNEPEN